jgi:LuxR family maltose regulon positive regulatory protein
VAGGDLSGALSLREHPRPDAFVERFTGTTRHVADFLSEDVLARQSGAVIEFLLQTCVLDELTASLCDALTGRAGSGSMLRELERGNLFVVPLDQERHAYRYHQLFAQYLRAELARRDPELVPELHRRAYRWYREHGLFGRAIAHAQAAGDVGAAGELVGAAWSDQIRDGQIETVRGWIEGFEDGEIARRAPLAIAAAWTAALSGQRGRAAYFIDAARRGSWEGPMPDGTASLESAIAVTSAAFGADTVSGMRRVAQRTLELEPAANRQRAIALEILGAALTLQGEFARTAWSSLRGCARTSPTSRPTACSRSCSAAAASSTGPAPPSRPQTRCCHG